MARKVGRRLTAGDGVQVVKERGGPDNLVVEAIGDDGHTTILELGDWAMRRGRELITSVLCVRQT
jgi:hypothetical protein